MNVTDEFIRPFESAGGHDPSCARCTANTIVTTIPTHMSCNNLKLGVHPGLLFYKIVALQPEDLVGSERQQAARLAGEQLLCFRGSQLSQRSDGRRRLVGARVGAGGAGGAGFCDLRLPV